jgi:hypothetical protein
MLKKLIHVLTFYVPIAFAQVVWSPIASNPNFDVGINYDSLSRSNGIAKFRIQTTDKSDRSIMYEDLEIDCSKKTFRSVWAKKYDWRNKVRGESSRPRNWDGIQPSTIMSVLHTRTCSQ